MMLATLFATGALYAHLGDSADRIEDLYGPMFNRHLRDDGTVTVSYHRNKDRYLYFVVFDRQRSVLERYSRVDAAELSKKEIASFLKLNAAGATWRPRTGNAQREFERSDHKAEAACTKVDGRPALTVRLIGG